VTILSSEGNNALFSSKASRQIDGFFYVIRDGYHFLQALDHFGAKDLWSPDAMITLLKKTKQVNPSQPNLPFRKLHCSPNWSSSAAKYCSSITQGYPSRSTMPGKQFIIITNILSEQTPIQD
jgi:hypothetical protein